MNRPPLRCVDLPSGQGGRFLCLAVLRRVGFVAVLLSIFAVGFGGTFTCETNQNSSDHTRPDPPP